MKLYLVVALLLVSRPARASYQCSELTIYQVCTYRDGYDMATCSRTYCGNSAYNCETCPGLLDGGVDLNVPSAMTSPGSGGCQMANGGDVGFSIAFFVLGGAVLYRRRRPAYLTGA